MDRSRIAIIIPALNEAATIGKVVASVREYGVPVVVDDGSSDATGEIARQAGADVVRHAINRGYDGALGSGFARAAELGCEYIITIDADGQHNPAQLATFIAQLDAGCEVVVGRRQRYQRLAETVLGVVARAMWRISDPVCGMKAYRTALYRRLGHFDSFHSIGTELAVRAIASGCRFAEVPVLTRERLDAPRFGRAFSANMKIFRATAILAFLHLSRRLAF